jgi:hypothetical protein
MVDIISIKIMKYHTKYVTVGVECHLQEFCVVLLMIWMVAPLVDKFGNMIFVENDVVVFFK